MNRVVFLVDGFNLYHSLATNPGYRRYRWLDLNLLCRRFCRKNDHIRAIYYFTALATWNQAKVERHRIYIRALQSRGVKPVYGEFKRRDHRCRLCNRVYQTFEEKQTDVNIAIHLLSLAVSDQYDTAVLLSGDSDLIPSIRAVHRTFPSKSVRVVIPIGRRAEALKQESDFHEKVKEVHLRTSLLPLEIRGDGPDVISCPPEWRS